jgi:transglutaminase-like putative cysteine protease
MYYSIRHVTKFSYNAPISESLMEVRMQPRSDGFQRCLSFDLSVSPRARIQTYRDYLGNLVHHFDIPGRHNQLAIKSEALVEILSPPEIPESLGEGGWQQLEEVKKSEDLWDMLSPSHFTPRSKLLEEFEGELNLQPGNDPLSLLRQLNTAIYNTFDYKPQSTTVDSPIDEALEKRQGVCQDYAHIMIALVRHLGIPCRYVSGYLFHQTDQPDRSAQDATHAWLEALLPDLGWVGFDPTNNLIAGERHIRTAIGRDYADVPPTRGVFKGEAETELKVAVQVSPTSYQLPETESTQMPSWSTYEGKEQQQQQQQ